MAYGSYGTLRDSGLPDVHVETPVADVRHTDQALPGYFSFLIFITLPRINASQIPCSRVVIEHTQSREATHAWNGLEAAAAELATRFSREGFFLGLCECSGLVETVREMYWKMQYSIHRIGW